MPNLNHIHSYVRWKIRIGRKQFDYLIKGEPVYKCVTPECTHFAPRSLLFNKQSSCPKCNTIFLLDTEALTRTTPMCLNCRGTKEGQTFRKAKDLIQEILGEI